MALHCSSGHDALRALGLGPSAIARATGLTKQAVDHYLKGRATPGIKTRKVLEKVYSIPANAWSVHPALKKDLTLEEGRAIEPPRGFRGEEVEVGREPPGVVEPGGSAFFDPSPHVAHEGTLEYFQEAVSLLRARIAKDPSASDYASLFNSLRQCLTKVADMQHDRAVLEGSWGDSPEFKAVCQRIYGALKDIPGAWDAYERAIKP